MSCLCYNRLVDNYCRLQIMKIGLSESAVHENVYFLKFLCVTATPDCCAAYTSLSGFCHSWQMLILSIYKHRQVLCTWNHENEPSRTYFMAKIVQMNDLYEKSKMSQWLMFRINFRVNNHILCYNRPINNYCVIWIMRTGLPEATEHENVFLGIQCHSDNRLLHRIHIIVCFVTSDKCWYCSNISIDKFCALRIMESNILEYIL